MQYLYRCDYCGHQETRAGSIQTPPPSAIYSRHFHEGSVTTYIQDKRDPGKPATGWRPLCPRTTLQRVFEAPMLNLGFRPAKHSRNDEHAFKHL